MENANKKMLQRGILEAQEIMAGVRTPARVRKYSGRILTEIVEKGETVWALSGDHEIELSPGDTSGQRVKAIRTALRQSQHGFAELLGISLGTLQGWEQDRRKPRATGRTLLGVALRAPEALVAHSEHDEVFS